MELGCTHSTDHTIKMTDETPFKEQFRQIPQPLAEEVRSHLQEMLESGAIEPSQSAWCNTVVLVRKKDGGLQFCIDFHCLNACTKRTPTLCPGSRRHWRVGRCRKFFLPRPQIRFWQIKMEEALKQYTTFTVGPLGSAVHPTCSKD